jgi:hypothetical protein
MSYARDQVIPSRSHSAADAALDARLAFIRRTYTHVFGAILAFVGLEAFLLRTPIAGSMLDLLGKSAYSWLIVLVLFMVVANVANKWARSDVSQNMQYAGLALYVVAEAFIFLPLLFIAASYSSPDVIPMAAITTLTVFTGLTAVVFVTKKDLSFLGMALRVGGFVALGLIVCAIIFGFQLGLLFAVVMAALAAGFILYETSNVLHHYRTDQHVAASLALFAAVALLFWYVLRIFMSRDR